MRTRPPTGLIPMRSSVSNRSFRSGLLFGAGSRRLTGRLSVAHRNYHEFARGNPRRTLSSQLSGKLTDSTLSAPCAELAAFWRAGLAELTVAFAKRSLSSRFVDTFTTPPLIVHWAGARSISAELSLVSESGRSLKGIRNSGPGVPIFGSCPSSSSAYRRSVRTPALSGSARSSMKAIDCG